MEKSSVKITALYTLDTSILLVNEFEQTCITTLKKDKYIPKVKKIYFILM